MKWSAGGVLSVDAISRGGIVEEDNIRYCLNCGEILMEWEYAYCDECLSLEEGRPDEEDK